jgi:hypothetical protein
MLKTLPRGVTDGLVTLNYSVDQKISIAQESLARAEKALDLAKKELSGLMDKAKDDDRYDIALSASTAWVEACESSKLKAEARLSKLKAVTNA